MKRFVLLFVLTLCAFHAQDIEEDYVEEMYVEPEVPL